MTVNTNFIWRPLSMSAVASTIFRPVANSVCLASSVSMYWKLTLDRLSLSSRASSSAIEVSMPVATKMLCLRSGSWPR
ncbi:hypothetical protein D9M71_801530 [compost metagenome]